MGADAFFLTTIESVANRATKSKQPHTELVDKCASLPQGIPLKQKPEDTSGSLEGALRAPQIQFIACKSLLFKDSPRALERGGIR